MRDFPSSQAAVSVDWVYQHLEHPHLVLVDCRFDLMHPELGRQQYTAGHLPGAYYLDLNQDLSGPVQLHGGRHPLPDENTLTATLCALGIDSMTSVVVAYDDSRLGFAARCWWLLRYLGCDRVAVMDGGFAAWQAAGYPTTTTLPEKKNGQFVPSIRTEWVIDRAGVKARQDQPGVILIDSREPERYRGEREPIDPIAGHIPGAINYPWQEVTDSSGHLRPLAEQKQRWSRVQTAKEIIVYCGSGVTACVNLLSLELAGIPNGRLYAGSWSDWCSY